MKEDGLVAGIRSTLPITLSALPFGMAAGLLAVDGGASVAEACAMSVLIFAGAAQLAALNLAQTGAPEALIIIVAVGINLRFVMYGAALAPYVRKASRLGRLGLAYVLTDQAFAISSARFAQERGGVRHISFYFGSAISLWTAWQIGTLLGATLGAQIPAALAVDLTAPLAFVALARMAIRDRADLVAAATACVTFGALHWLPHGLALFPAAAVGVIAGRLMEREAQ